MAQFIACIEVLKAPEKVDLTSITINTNQIESWTFTEAKHEKALVVDPGCEASYYIAVKMISGKTHNLRHTEKQLIDALNHPANLYVIEG